MNVLRLDHINGVLDARLNILHFEIWIIIPNDGLNRNRLPNQLENRLHRNACPGNTRLAKMNLAADLNSIHSTSILPDATQINLAPGARSARGATCL
jgi:hypothetical protein